MPAINMGGDPTAENPSTGKPVLMSPFSGPKGSMLDNDQPGNHSTGAINTGIGFGPNMVINAPAIPNAANAGFTQNYFLGSQKPNGDIVLNATLLAIGGGHSTPPVGGASQTVPLITGDGSAMRMFAFGNGAERDGTVPGAGRWVQVRTAISNVAPGANITSGQVLVNRSGVTILTGQTTLGVRAGTSSQVVKGGSLIVSNPTVDNTAKTVTANGTARLFVEGASLVTKAKQGATEVTGTATVTGGLIVFTAPLSLATFIAGTVDISVSGKDQFGYDVTGTASAPYAPV